MPTVSINRPPYRISDDRSLLDLDVVHGYLTRSYWAEGIQKPRVQRAMDHSECFGLYEVGRGGDGDEVLTQIGFARVLTDFSAIAYLMDVFVLEPWQGKGLGKWIVEVVLNDARFEPVRRWILATEDAHSLYTRHGFTPLEHPEHYLHRYVADKYLTDPPAPENS